MKVCNLKLFIALFLIVGILSCNSSSTESSSSSGAPAQGSSATDEPEGLTIMKRYDCATCHNATAKIVGPAFKDIAAKYPNTPENIALLVGKVISGGSGVWGTIPMAAHPTLPKQDAEKIVGYILNTFKKE